MSALLSLFNQVHTAQLQAVSFSQKIAVIKQYDDFICQFPQQMQALLNRSILLQELGFYDLALNDVERALNLEPNRADAWCHRAFLLLLLGRYREGWASYEWRWKMPQFKHPTEAIPIWQGQEIGAAKLLIYAEQGLGDNIQFVRYAFEAKTRGFNIIVLNHASLESLLNYNLSLQGIETATNGCTMPQPDYLVSMMSLPYLFHTTLNSIPCPTPYLQTEPTSFAKFQQKLTACKEVKSKKTKIGVVWAGSLRHSRNQIRSVDFSLFRQIFALDADFHCLQKEVSPTDLADCDTIQNLTVWHKELDDFSDTAGLIAQMDLVISVDTSVAHLAAALGVPTWVLVSYHPDYRWLVGREDSPWYSSVRLFRQQDFDDWTATLEHLKAQLMLKLSR